MPPDLLLVGHIVRDIVPSGWRPGGGVVYAAAQACRLGLRVAAVTSCGEDVDPPRVLDGVDWRVVPSPDTTTFENRYLAGTRRQQRVLARARPLALADLPAEWRPAPITLLAPVFHDVDPELPSRLTRPGSLVGLGAQGWLRRLEGESVRPGRVDRDARWLAGDAVFVSDEDVEEPEAVAIWQGRVPIVILTRGRGGCTVWSSAGRSDLPAFTVEEVDPTGAGDVFAAAFLIRLKESGDMLGAARFGGAAAALSVRAEGLSALAGREEIESLVRSGEAVRA